MRNRVKKEGEMNTVNILKSLQSGLIKDEVSLLCECRMLEIDYWRTTDAFNSKKLFSIGNLLKSAEANWMEN
jgi:hypothetical protein